MKELINRAIVLCLAILCAISIVEPLNLLYIVIAGVIYSSYMYYFENNEKHLYINIALMVLIVLNSLWHSLIILLFYDITLRILKKQKADIIAGTIFTVFLIIQLMTGISEITVFSEFYSGMIWIFGGLTSVYLSYSFFKYDEAESNMMKLRDDSEEFRQLTIQKNVLMRQKQDKDIETATLNERNRIAREVHDNVGHLLTRSIVQMGALQVVYKDEPLNSSLKQVSETLNESMMNIRHSVHDLHNEALDMKKVIEELLKKHDEYTYSFNYDIENESEVSIKVKYCLISIITEALSNIEKHSDADKITISINEHPAFYQVIIHDNGHPSEISESGIGLHNMKSRVEELDGRIDFSINKGFKIFLTIPKGAQK